MKKLKRAFTLIEMLIVITIIGILASALVPRIMGVQDRAKTAKAVIDMNTILNAIYAARGDNGKRLADISGRQWTAQPCQLYSGDLRNISSGSLCFTERMRALTNILSYSNISTGGLARDPWGSPYLLDENDGEMLNNGGCSYDVFRSVGPNGLDSQSFNGGAIGVPQKSTTSDDIYVLVPKIPKYQC